ncbi:AraC family transcriptional regulator [Paenibacillus antri]|uniref:AraC family transcriptional regulator n=1 Tax=Paenibacillus antri TaxID=2582848 RepID=UPI001EE3C89F|nr:AraC family transcriptional regulator [Paenibacillus antri]
MRKREGFDSEKILVLPESRIRELSSHPLLRPLFATDIGYFPHAKYHYRERPDGCDAYILMLCVGGAGWIQVGEEKRKEVGKYDVVVLPPGAKHRYGASEDNPWSIYWVHFRGESARDFVDLLPLESHTLQVSGRDAVRLIEWFQPCYELLSRQGYSLAHCLFANQQLQQLLSFLAMQRTPGGDDSSKETVERSIQYMMLHLGSNLSLRQLSEQANLSRSHYSAVFKRVTGASPLHYFTRLKMQQACTYLDLSAWSAKEIGAKLGYGDSLYFSRVFRKEIGMSPTEYRRKMKG